MQTRRDQLQAYRFQNRRALAALVTGEPNVLEPPMRRLTVTTLAGIMVAVLIGVVVGLLALFRPTAGTSWRKDGTVIIDDQTGSSYVYLHDVLHPAANYTSAVLAVSSSQAVSPVHVSSGDLSGARYGAEIGIPSLPNSLPPASQLLSWPASLCSREQPVAGGSVKARASLLLGDASDTTPLGRPVAAGHGVLVAQVGGDGYELLADGTRRAMSTAVAQSLRVDTADAVRVGPAFLDGVPAAAPYAPPALPGAGDPATVTLAGDAVRIGQVVDVGATPYLVLRDGLSQLTPVQAAVAATASPAATVRLPASTTLPTQVSLTQPAPGFAALPSTLPTLDTTAAAHGGVCLTWHRAGAAATMSVPPSALGSAFTGADVGDTVASRSGLADSVQVPATHALLVVPGDHGTGTEVIGDQGVRYPVASPAVLAAFGYSAKDAMRIPAQLLGLVRQGPALSPAAALRTVTR